MDKKATLFEFASYEFNPAKKQVVFYYATHFEGGGVMHFTETILFPKAPNLKNLPKELLEKLLQSLHIMLGISYYKFYCAPEIKLPYSLSKGEADFFTTVYQKGLGEFFYKNSLDPNLSPKFPHDDTVKTTNYSLPTTNSRSLVGIGGGKDSIVAVELLKEAGF
ncbi:MAG: hypothetical protein ACHQVK_00625, partial [Candidatus Paceibacterales bacterium]